MTFNSQGLFSLRRITGTAIILMLLVISGCSSIGPAAVHDTAALETATAQVQTSKAQLPKTHYKAALAELTAGDMDRASLEVKLELQENPREISSPYFSYLEPSQLYRSLSGQELTSEDVGLELLGPKAKH